MSPEGREVTNPKVAGLEPSWRSYSGLSVLFDNPGPTRGAQGGIRGLTVPDAGDAPLFEALAGASRMLGTAGMRDAYGFCRLPPATYHVTVCDGVNELQAPEIRTRVAGAVRSVLRGLPQSLAQLPASLAFLSGPELSEVARAHPITFPAAEVVGWGSVLAVRLEAASRDDGTVFSAIEGARDRFASVIEECLGLRVQGWRPHVSLAYFADRSGAADAEAEIPQWSRALLDSVGEATVCFSSVSLYGFTDMATFFRAARPQTDASVSAGP